LTSSIRWLNTKVDVKDFIDKLATEFTMNTASYAIVSGFYVFMYE